MEQDIAHLTGGCACGAVRIRTLEPPLRVGLCHCMTCRKAHGAAFNPFVVFAAEAVQITGPTRSWFSSEGYDPACGSRVIAFNGDEVELSIGSLDEPGQLSPHDESWVLRREPWLGDLGIVRHERERPSQA